MILRRLLMCDRSGTLGKEYLPYTMELGRSFVRPEYQTAAAGRKSLFTLDNLWDGITGVVLSSPGIDYLFGKMTIYNSYDKAARELILHFLEKHFPDNDCLVRPYQTMVPDTDPRILELLLVVAGKYVPGSTIHVTAKDGQIVV